MCTAHGHPVLLAETFVDPSRFSGVCYRASNWVWLGRTSGYSRVYGSPVRWRAHGRPKDVYVYELEAGAREALRDGDDPAGWAEERRAAAPTAEALCSLHEPARPRKRTPRVRGAGPSNGRSLHRQPCRLRKARKARLGGSGAGRRGPRKRTPGAWGAAPSI